MSSFWNLDISKTQLSVLVKKFQQNFTLYSNIYKLHRTQTSSLGFNLVNNFTVKREYTRRTIELSVVNTANRGVSAVCHETMNRFSTKLQQAAGISSGVDNFTRQNFTWTS